ncbi:MAG: hypothetical protein MRECE_13c035 [Mycoplasmataceae bacterium CE_OT135]|nr:MAG: hypothetical protein MRECE_13c035 [Mycoplasmataceae bacterium CE_OT135]
MTKSFTFSFSLQLLSKFLMDIFSIFHYTLFFKYKHK